MVNENAGDDYSQNPRDKAELLERIQREWTRLSSLVDGLSAEQMSVPDAGGWSIKDNLAHLTTWERALHEGYLHNLTAEQILHVDPAVMQDPTFGTINAILYERNRNRSAKEVLDDFRRSHDELLAALERYSYADLMQPRFADDPEKRPLIGWVIGDTYDHYKEHRESIEKIVKKL